MAKVTLEQWRMLHAVVEHGGFAQASEALHKSQSTISYAVSKLQRQLGVEILKVRGRKAELTDAGQVMLRRSLNLLKEAETIEKAAHSLSEGWEALITIAMDVVFPPEILYQSFGKLAGLSEHTRLEMVETVLSGTTDLLISGEADLAVSAQIPQGFLGEPLLKVPFTLVAHKDHPLHQLPTPISHDELKRHRQIVLRDSGVKRTDAGWLEAEQRWTVSHITTSIRLVCDGMGFARLPAYHIQEELKSGLLKPIQLDPSANSYVQVYLIYADRDYAGQATKALASIIQETTEAFLEKEGSLCESLMGYPILRKSPSLPSAP